MWYAIDRQPNSQLLRDRTVNQVCSCLLGLGFHVPNTLSASLRRDATLQRQCLVLIKMHGVQDSHSVRYIEESALLSNTSIFVLHKTCSPNLSNDRVYFKLPSTPPLNECLSPSSEKTLPTCKSHKVERYVLAA